MTAETAVLLELADLDPAALRCHEQRLDTALRVVRAVLAVIDPDENSGDAPRPYVIAGQPPVVSTPPAAGSTDGTYMVEIQVPEPGTEEPEPAPAAPPEPVAPPAPAAPAPATNGVQAAAPPAKSHAERARAPHQAGRRNDEAVLAVLERNGETPQASLISLAAVPEGSITSVCGRLRAAGKIEVREQPGGSDGGRRRKLWRLSGQPVKADTYGGVGAKVSSRKRKREERQAAVDEAERAEAGTSLRHRLMVTFEGAGDDGLTMDQAVTAVTGDEPAAVIRDRVREMWNAGTLARRRDGSFVIASTRSWTAASPAETTE